MAQIVSAIHTRSLQGAGALGQHQMAPGIPAIDLLADAPVGNPKASAYLLAVYAGWFPAGTVFLCIVDPGVGGARPSIILEADGGWYVGPGNGLFELVQRRAKKTRSWWGEKRGANVAMSQRWAHASISAQAQSGAPVPPNGFSHFVQHQSPLAHQAR
jgi:hypothetical protein